MSLSKDEMTMLSGQTIVGGTERSGGERSEAPRSGGPPTIEREVPARPTVLGADPEVTPRPKRRRFTAEDKLEILRKADACKEPGQIGELLRREGLYSSSLASWRQQRRQGTLGGLNPKRRGRKPEPPNPLARRVVELERENTRLQWRLKQVEALLEVQKKVSEILGIPLNSQDSEEND